MKKLMAFVCLLMAVCAGCKKELVVFVPKEPTPIPAASKSVTGFLEYTIPQGAQYCDSNPFTPIQYKQLAFMVKFDSSAIYTTLDPQNQSDINKLYGFADNGADHHDFSARIGWRWSNNALRLFGYVYNAGVRTSQEIGAINIGQAYQCTIEVLPNAYRFKVEDKQINMPRLATTPLAIGYKLYPYFGGDELAPHKIKIWIKELN